LVIIYEMEREETTHTVLLRPSPTEQHDYNSVV
jgi:hypothetical protein